MLEFGVGLISFAVQGSTEPVLPEVWKETVQRSLHELPNVTELVIADDAEEFSFVISIPRHLHRDVPDLRKVSERYRVRTITGYRSQFSFVASLDPTDEGEGAIGVRIVREQLEKQLELDPRIKLHTLGPSPFHCNFTLIAGKDLQAEPLPKPIVGIVNPKGGYDEAVFAYDPDVYEDELQALDAVQELLRSELSVFYELVAHRNARLERAVQIGHDTEELIELHSARGLRSGFRRLFLSGGRARALALSVMQAEFAVAEDRELFKESMDATYNHTEGYFRKYLEREAAEEFASFVDNGSKVVKHLESGRTKELEVAVVAAATLVGGVSGGIVSAIVAAPK